MRLLWWLKWWKSNDSSETQIMTKKVLTCGDFPPLIIPRTHQVEKGAERKKATWGQAWVTFLSRFCGTLHKVFLASHRNAKSILSSMDVTPSKVIKTAVYWCPGCLFSRKINLNWWSAEKDWYRIGVSGFLNRWEEPGIFDLANGKLRGSLVTGK